MTKFWTIFNVQEFVKMFEKYSGIKVLDICCAQKQLEMRRMWCEIWKRDRLNYNGKNKNYDISIQIYCCYST